MEIEPIGIVHSPYNEPGEIPCCQGDRLKEEAVVEVYRDFSEGIRDLDGFSHILLVVHLHKAKDERLLVFPYLDDQKRGVFSTRSPHRPNHIGISIVELMKVEGRNLLVKGIDLLDGTPLLDIKPYIPYEARAPLSVGWLEGKIPTKYPPPEANPGAG